MKSLRRSVLRISSCSCLLRPKISCAIGLTHICTRSKNENDDLSATEMDNIRWGFLSSIIRSGFLWVYVKIVR